MMLETPERKKTSRETERLNFTSLFSTETNRRCETRLRQTSGSEPAEFDLFSPLQPHAGDVDLIVIVVNLCKCFLILVNDSRAPSCPCVCLFVSRIKQKLPNGSSSDSDGGRTEQNRTEPSSFWCGPRKTVLPLVL